MTHDSEASAFALSVDGLCRAFLVGRDVTCTPRRARGIAELAGHHHDSLDVTLSRRRTSTCPVPSPSCRPAPTLIGRDSRKHVLKLETAILNLQRTRGLPGVSPCPMGETVSYCLSGIIRWNTSIQKPLPDPIHPCLKNRDHGSNCLFWDGEVLL